MKFAINYSKITAALITEGRIDTDYFKCPDWPGMITTALHYRPVTVHFSLRAGTGKLHKTNWSQIESLLKLTGTPYVNLHLCPEVSDFPSIPDGIQASTQEPSHRNFVIERLLEDVSEVVEHFGADRVIAENVAYWGSNGSVIRPATEPEVIRRILEETGCGLLLDISHARIAARNLAMEENEYLATLPLKRTRELHLTGLHNVANGWQDHLAMLPDDWQWVDYAVDHVKRGDWGSAWLLAFEYGGEGGFFGEHTDPVTIAEQVPVFMEKIHNRG